MDYSDFIENYDNENISLFEKTLLVINRTNDLYKGKIITFKNQDKYRTLDCAIYEINKKNIEYNFTEKIIKKENFSINEETIEDSLLNTSNDKDNISAINIEKNNEELLSQIKIDYREEE